MKNNYRLNIVLNYLFRCFSVILGLFIVNVYLNYLGETLYGLWLTIASIVSWMSSGDLGISNGLRNELAIAYGEGNTHKQKCLIATAVHTISYVAIGLIILITLICELFFATGILEKSIRLPMHITTIFLGISLVTGISHSIANSFQKSWYVTCASSFVQLLSIVAVLMLGCFGIRANLTVFAIVHGICIFIPDFILILFFRSRNIKIFEGIRENYRPRFRKNILSLGIQFFGLQICSIVLYSTDNVIINYLMDSSMVTKYSIVTKVYDTGSSIFSILLIALWSAVTYRLAKNDVVWVEKNIKKLLGVWGLFCMGVLVVSLNFNTIIELWLGCSRLYYEPSIIILFAIYCCLASFSAIFVNILNGMGIIKFQLIIAAIGAIANIPLSVFFSKYCGWGLFGIKFATFLAILLLSITMPIQVLIELKKRKDAS